MKLRLRRHETGKTLKLEWADTATLHYLRRRINSSTPYSVHLSLNGKDELIVPSPKDTLRSLGITSDVLIYYSFDRSVFSTSVEEIRSASPSAEAHQTLNPNGESKTDLNLGMEGPMDVELSAAKKKRLSEAFFLKKILLEKSGDASDLTTLATSVHAVMLESGFVLLSNHGSEKFSFSKSLLSISLRYTLPELIRDTKKTIGSVTVRFQSLSNAVVVYGSLDGYRGHRVCLSKHRFVPVIDLVVDTLKFEKQASLEIYREVFMFWRMVKDDLAIPLLIGLCDKSGLQLPPCLMRLPTELKLKILESIPGTSVAKMACVCTEMRYLASDNDLWKHKCLEEAKHLVVNGSGDSSVDWKVKFAFFWRQHHQRRVLPSYLMREKGYIFPRFITDVFRFSPHPQFTRDHVPF